MTKKPDDAPSPKGDDEHGDERDERGRFKKGRYRGGPGNPLARQATAMRKAAMDAIGPDHVGAILRKVARKALEGDLRAARIVLDRVLGRPREEADIAAPIDINLPDLETAKDCARAASMITDALCAGAVNQSVARVLLEAIQTRVRSIEVTEIEERLAELEKAAASVDQGSVRRGRRN